MAMICEFHRCGDPATIIFKWSDRQKAACDGHAVEFYRATLDPRPMNSIRGTIDAGARTKPDHDGSVFRWWKKKLYENLGGKTTPLHPKRTNAEHEQMAANNERQVQGWLLFIAGRRACRDT